MSCVKNIHAGCGGVSRDTSTWEVETLGIGVHSKVETSLGSMRPHLKERAKKEKERGGEKGCVVKGS